MPTTLTAITISFNTQPPEGGWLTERIRVTLINNVSTHSRPKAAGLSLLELLGDVEVSTHSRPKAAGTAVCKGAEVIAVSTHSRPKAAGMFRLPLLN